MRRQRAEDDAQAGVLDKLEVVEDDGIRNAEQVPHTGQGRGQRQGTTVAAAPTEAALFDPERNARYGARYLARQLGRFDGRVAVALYAYNVGPAAVPSSWRDLVARGGEALFCELAPNPLGRDYARRILGYRQAYRELRPTSAP